MRRRPRILKFSPLLGIIFLFGALEAESSTIATSPGSALFDTTPIDWEIDITIDEVSGLVNNLVSVYESSSDDTQALIEGEALISPPDLDAQLSPVDTGPASGRARVLSTLENIGDASGMFYGNNGERIRIRSSSSLVFDLEFLGASDTADSTAIICLMPIQLAVVQGAGGANPASASYAYSLEVDGNEIFSSSVRLSGTASSVQLTTLAGEQRTDGVFFDDASHNTFGIRFPSLTIAAPMGAFAAGEIKEAQLRFTTTIEGGDDGSGGYAGPTNGSVSPNLFVPVPEPQPVGLLVLGMVLTVWRRGRPARR